MNSNLTSKIVLGLFIAIIAVAFLIAAMIVGFGITNYMERKSKEKKDMAQGVLMKNKNHEVREKSLEEITGRKKNKRENEVARNEKIDDDARQMQNNNIFDKMIEDLNLNHVIYGNQAVFQVDFQNRMKNFFSSEVEVSTAVIMDRKKKYDESKKIVSDLKNKRNKTENDVEQLEWANVFIKFHEENLNKINPDVQRQEFFKQLGIDLEDLKNRKISQAYYNNKVYLIDLLLYRASIIYGYFKKYTLDKLPENSSFHKDGFKKECVYIAQNICRESLRRMADKNLNSSNYNQDLQLELKVFDGLFFKKISESFQSRLRMAEEDLLENQEYNEMMNRDKTDDEIIEEELEGGFFNKNKNDLERKIFQKQHATHNQENYFQVIPNPYLPRSGFDMHGDYKNDSRYNHDGNLQQDILDRDQRLEESKAMFQRRFEEISALKTNNKKSIIQDHIINPRLQEEFVIGFVDEVNNSDPKNIDDLIKTQEEQVQTRKNELENIKNIAGTNQKLQAILADRKKNADFYENHLYYPRDNEDSRGNLKKIIKLDFSEEYLKELKYIYKTSEKIIQRIDIALRDKNYKKLIVEFYKEGNDLGNKNDKELYKNYINYEKKKYENNTQIIAELNSMLQKVNNNEDIGENLKSYHLDRYLEDEIENINEMEKFLKKRKEEFSQGFENSNDINQEEVFENSFINGRRNLLNAIDNLRSSQEYKNKIEKVFNELKGLLVDRNLSGHRLSTIFDERSSNLDL